MLTHLPLSNILIATGRNNTQQGICKISTKSPEKEKERKKERERKRERKREREREREREMTV